MDQEVLSTAREVDAQIKIPASTVHRMHRAGLLQGYYVGATGRGVRFRISEIIDAIKKKPVTVPVKKKVATKKTAKAAVGKQKG